MQIKTNKIDITPNFPCRIIGMSAKEQSNSLHSPLEINSILLKQNDSHLFILSVDTLFINGNLKKLIVEEISKHFGYIGEADILIIATHTHYAPSLEEKRVDLGPIDECYFLLLKSKVKDLVRGLFMQKFTDCNIEICMGGSDDLTVNRRRRVRRISSFFKTFISMEADVNGYKNETIKIIKIIDAKDKNKILSTIWTLPCHPTNLYNKSLVSSEFPGAIRKSIRENQDNKEMIMVYMPGFAGDVRAAPPPRFSILKTIRYILQLSYPTKYFRFTNKEEYDAWIFLLTKRFNTILGSPSTILNLNSTLLNSKIMKKDVSILGINAEGVDNITFRKITIGGELAFYTISAEPVSAYSKIIDTIAKEKFSFYTGYSDEVFGYLPTDQQIKEGGYESSGFFKPFLITGNFKPSIENIVATCFKEMN